MANRKITVLNPAGYQELFQSGDNLVVDGSVNLQSNGLTGVPAPSENLDATNKSYVDLADSANTSNITTNASAIEALDTRLTTAEGDIAVIPSAGDAQVDINGSVGVTVTGGSFTLDQTTDVTINIEGPDLTNFLIKPDSDGDYLVTNTSGVITYTSYMDGGQY